MEAGPAAGAAAAAAYAASFPAGLCTLASLQPALPHVPHRYVLASSPDALFVAFAGTLDARDMWADVNFLQAEMWLGDAPSTAGGGDAVRGLGCRVWVGL